MTITPLPLTGAFEITLSPRGDHRGYFMRTFDRDTFVKHGMTTDWVQANESLSSDIGTLRGLHFHRAPHAEVKLVQAVTGAIWDVIVDIREGSPTFGHHYGAVLSYDNHKCFYVPKGFAHGFCVIQAPAIVRYMVDESYAPHAESALRWNDPELGIVWPVTDPIITEKDASAKLLRELEPIRL
jgi:dTDP-4-dehydrorhamnose 3,5-epimerase